MQSCSLTHWLTHANLSMDERAVYPGLDIKRKGLLACFGWAADVGWYENKNVWNKFVIMMMMVCSVLSSVSACPFAALLFHFLGARKKRHLYCMSTSNDNFFRFFVWITKKSCLPVQSPHYYFIQVQLNGQEQKGNRFMLWAYTLSVACMNYEWIGRKLKKVTKTEL